MPLLFQRIPSLALVEIFKCIGLFESIALAHTSKKTRRIVRTYCKLSIGLEITCTPTSKSIGFQIGEYIKDRSAWIKLAISLVWKFDDGPAHVDFYMDNHKRVVTHLSLEEMERLMAIIKFLVETFRVRYTAFTNSSIEAEGPYQLLEFLGNLKLPVWYIDWNTAPNFQSIVQNVFTKAIDAKELDISLRRTENYKFERFHELHLDRLNISGSHWMTLDDLLALRNCSNVTLSHSNFTCEEVNKSIKTLIRNHGKLISLEVSGTNPITIVGLLSGLEHIEIGENMFRIALENDGRMEVERGETRVSMKIITR